MLKHTHSICQFLHYGYLLEGSVELPVLLERNRRAGRSAGPPARPLAALIREGVEKWSVACDATLGSRAEAARHLLPLSGGMDSRAILGGLLKKIDPSRIHGVTFGTPGTWDFDIGRLVAETTGIVHTPIDLSQIPWDTESLVRFAGECERPIRLFEAYLFHLMRIRFGRDSVYWSGFMGDPLSGSHLVSRESTTWDQARSRFAARSRSVHSVVLVPPAYKPEGCLPQSPLLSQDDLCYDEQLDFGVRQQCYIKPVVLLKGYKYCTPFLHSEWANFILGVPRRYRHGQFLYKEILKAAYPSLFSLPAKNSYGLPLTTPHWRQVLRRHGLRVRTAVKYCLPWVNWGVSPSVNYLDFERVLRERADLKATVYENIADLKKRGILDWMEIENLWRRHQRGQGNHADALLLLASLEVHLKVQDRALP